MLQTDVVDPRSNVDYEIVPGMVFTDARATDDRELVVEYADRDGGVKYRDTAGDADRETVYHWDTYEQFEKNVGAGRYTPLTDDVGDFVYRGWMGQVHRLRDDYVSRDGRTADHKVEAIDEVIAIIEDDVPDDHNEPVDFESIDGIGSAAADSLHANGFTTKGDVRNASAEQIKSVPNMGSKNTENLLEVVDNE